MCADTRAVLETRMGMTHPCPKRLGKTNCKQLIWVNLYYQLKERIHKIK
jgi:hypothetical protein